MADIRWPVSRRVLVLFLCVVVGTLWGGLSLYAAPAAQEAIPCRPDLTSPTGLPASPSATAFTDPCQSPNRPSAQYPNTPTVIRIPFADEDALLPLTGNLDVWKVNHGSGEVVALIYPGQERWLQLLGYSWTLDEEKTSALSRPTARDAAQTSGIPGYACYRTVGETYADMVQLAADKPALAQWIDIGDSYDKVTPGGPAGSDIHALVLTNQNSSAVEKGKFVLIAAIHAREYATAEIAARFAEKLAAGYGVDPDITWLLDYNEIHIIPQANPDGRGMAELGYSWRKNTDRPAACNSAPNNAPYSYGVDLNRNSSFLWGTCGGGCSSADPCSVLYRGASAGSEPEVQAIESYMRTVFADQRGPNIGDAAPVDTNGVFISLHSYGNLVIYSWDFTGSDAPNMAELRRLGRKFGYHNRYSVCNTSNCLYAVDGSTTDFAYGEFGVATYTFEVGTTFFQSCSYFENSIVQQNLDALLYAAKAARRPYQVAAGPDTLSLALSAAHIDIGQPITLTATADDTRYYANGYGVEPSQAIAGARYSIDKPSWEITATHSLSATDGAFNATSEGLRALVDTTGWTPGRHTLFVESQDSAGNWGVPSAGFIAVYGLRGLQLEQSPASADATSGQTVTHTLTLTNTGQQTEQLVAVIRSETWAVEAGQPALTLQPNISATLQITVSVPLSASIGMTNVTVVDITSTYPGLLRTATLQTVVTKEPTSEPGGTPPNIYFPWIYNE
ncbi:MAG: M14 family zinc carboxypeptidase [Caldilineaceae bacterium]